MNHEALHGRIVIGEGKEHLVLRRPNSKRVVKAPKLSNYMLMLGRDRAETMRQELADAQSVVRNTEVKIPRTLILSTRANRNNAIRINSYVIGQQYIEEDKSIIDIKTHLEKQNNPVLVDVYSTEHQNFISNKGVLYWIDPTQGRAGRLLEHTKIMKATTFRKVRRKMLKALGFQN